MEEVQPHVGLPLAVAWSFVVGKQAAGHVLLGAGFWLLAAFIRSPRLYKLPSLNSLKRTDVGAVRVEQLAHHRGPFDHRCLAAGAPVGI